jgi:SAM-dependent methyltransferase
VYVNLDIQRCKNGEPSTISDAHSLPFRDASFQLVVSKDTLEHFLQPWTVVREVHRVLRDQGQFVIWVPFMHPFHSDDLYRYSPLGLRYLLSDFEIVRFESPSWVFTVVGLAGIIALKRIHLGFMERPIKSLTGWLDRRFTRSQKEPASFAAAYRIVARKKSKLR